MKRFLFFWVTVLVFIGSISPATEAKTLSELLPELLDSHERMKASVNRQDSAFYSWRASKSSWYPRFDLTGDVAHEDIKKSRSDPSVTSEAKNVEKLRATQMLWDFGATNSAIAQSKALFDQSVSDKVATRQGLIREGVAAYLNLIRFSRQLGYAIQSEKSIMRQTGMEESLVRRGAGLSSDVLQAKSQLAGASALRVITEGNYANAKNRFLAVYGFNVSDGDVKKFKEPIVPFDKIPSTLDEAIQTAFKENPQLIRAQKEIVLAKKGVTAARSRFYPSFNLFGEFHRKERDGGLDEAKEESRLGVEFNYNLYAGGGDLAALRSARHTSSGAVNALLDLQRTIEEQVRVSWQNLLTARGKAEWFGNQANIEGEFLELARKERKLGNRSLLDVLTAEVTHINALSGAVSAEIDKAIAAYDLLFAMGWLEVDLFVE
ncbi:MAG: TolC family protein [Thermodesulfobacteriota bacterium]|nr:TolC family protein [Thermodesulfobacteriota bacterium]